MKELINISGQQFYYSTIDQVIERCSKKERCAVIIDEFHLDEFLNKVESKIEECVDQIIVISDNVDKAMDRLEGVSVLLIAVGSFEEGVRVAILGTALNKDVICIPKEDMDTIGEIIDVIVT